VIYDDRCEWAERHAKRQKGSASLIVFDLSTQYEQARVEQSAVRELSLFVFNLVNFSFMCIIFIKIVTEMYDAWMAANVGKSIFFLV
jgi:hypothetical protein